jgi:hypothetical protein
MLALVDANDDTLDLFLIVAVVLLGIAAVMSFTRNAAVAGIGYLGVAAGFFALMFITGP